MTDLDLNQALLLEGGAENSEVSLEAWRSFSKLVYKTISSKQVWASKIEDWNLRFLKQGVLKIALGLP